MHKNYPYFQYSIFCHLSISQSVCMHITQPWHGEGQTHYMIKIKNKIILNSIIVIYFTRDS